MITSSAFAGRSYCVLGLASSGMASVEALLASGARVTAWDRNPEPREALAGRVDIADPLDLDLRGFAGIVVSPGVPLNTHPIAQRAADAGVPVIGDIELFALARPMLPAHRVIGITGTNGKSTTTALAHHLLVVSGRVATMGGNIGLPIMGQQPLAAGGVYVLELSSFQIDLTFSLACDAAALSNITPDHLDRYGAMEAYAAAKARLFAMQRPDQFAVFGCEDGYTRAIHQAEAARRQPGRSVCLDVSALAGHQPRWPGLQGPHNLQNAALAAALVREIGLDEAAILAGMASFRGLPHRMEPLCTCGGVLFVNDSKATNPASAAPALAAYPPAPGPRIHWICGGLPKEETLGQCEEYFGHVACAYTIGEAAPLFGRLLDGRVPVEACELLSEAVCRAVRRAQPGDVVLLSPACASYDQFRDYGARGDAFRTLVAEVACAGERGVCGEGEGEGEGA